MKKLSIRDIDVYSSTRLYIWQRSWTKIFLVDLPFQKGKKRNIINQLHLVRKKIKDFFLFLAILVRKLQSFYRYP